MSVIPKTVIVTGANRGIGQAICTLLLLKPDVGPVQLFATSRKGEPLGFSPRDPSTQEIVYPSLDIEHSDSIRSLVQRVKRESPTGRIDVLINNAGVYFEAHPRDGKAELEKARKTLDVNYWGVKEMCENFIPHLSPNGRMVNMSSVASSTKDYSTNIRARFRNPDITFPELEALIEEYLSSLQSGNNHNDENSFGPPNRAYNFSKSCVNVLTHILAREHPGLSIHSCCPGWVRTDMGQKVGPSPPKTPEDGARIPLRLAFGDLQGRGPGGFWANSSVRSREEGNLRVWAEDGGHVDAPPPTAAAS